MTQEPMNPFEALTSGGGFDMNALLQQAQQMQEQLAAAQEKLNDTTVEGTSGGVSVTVTGVGDLVGVTIAPDAVDPADPEALADLGDLVVAAYRDAKTRVEQLTADSIAPLTGGGLPGMPQPGQLGF